MELRPPSYRETCLKNRDQQPVETFPGTSRNTQSKTAGRPPEQAEHQPPLRVTAGKRCPELVSWQTLFWICYLSCDAGLVKCAHSALQHDGMDGETAAGRPAGWTGGTDCLASGGSSPAGEEGHDLGSRIPVPEASPGCLFLPPGSTRCWCICRSSQNRRDGTASRSGPSLWPAGSGPTAGRPRTPRWTRHL